MPRISDEHRAARREQILLAAIACVGREGFHRTTMAHVIAESGLSAGAVYGYFKGKAELIRAIADRAVGQLADVLVELAEGDEPVTVVGALREVLERIEGFAGQPGAPFPGIAVHAWSEAARDPEVREIVDANLARIHHAWTRVLARAEAEGSLAPGVDHEALARALLGLMPGYVLQGVLLRRVDVDTYVRGVEALTRC